MKKLTDTIRIGTRGSALALKQAQEVKARLLRYDPTLKTDTVIISTKGDENLKDPLSELGDKGLFTKELEQALYEDAVDIAVHSMKDMPSELPKGLAIAAVLPREDARDVFVGNGVSSIRDLKKGARVGTSSIRRAAQLKALREDVRCVSIRGNVETRIRKMKEEGLDGIILACAGLNRLNLTEHISERIDVKHMLPAPCQGIIAVEAVENSQAFSLIRNALNDMKTQCEAAAERAFLQRMEGGCKVPVAALAVREGNTLTVTGRVLQPDGKRCLEETFRGECGDGEALGRALADHLIKNGAKEILEKIKAEAGDERI